ncbi:Xaa-Pro peptidase family protein [Brevibacterium daeguense]|uniref:Xaa-Pro peptidase family protein n=1 Tax=Brevibacterium daeguense TaxID=909936 RepID=A0ABP8EJZ2_9MICO|nr:M24 family metallopeptidase [Brevibacterium daeguense]
MLFTAEEYEARLARVRARMADQGLRALIVTDPANIYYLTAYNAWSFYTPQMLFVPYQGDMVFFAREMDANGAFRTSWLPESCIEPYPEAYVHRADIHPFDWIAQRLRRRKLIAPTTGVVGLEMDSNFFTAKSYRALVNAVPEWTLVDSFELVNWVRAVKSEAEIVLMRKAATITTAAMEAARETIAVGVIQAEVASAISAVQFRGAGELAGDYPAIVPMMPTGEAADTPHLTWSGQRFERDQIVIIELGGVYKRYHVPLARTFTTGAASENVRYLAEAVDTSLQAMIETIASGVAVSELAQAWNRSLFTFGLTKESRLGYSIGVGYPPDWGERTISIRTEDETVLEPNMTFHLIAGMWMDGYGYECSEPVRVTADGVELFTDLPRGVTSTLGSSADSGSNPGTSPVSNSSPGPVSSPIAPITAESA